VVSRSRRPKLGGKITSVTLHPDGHYTVTGDGIRMPSSPSSRLPSRTRGRARSRSRSRSAFTGRGAAWGFRRSARAWEAPEGQSADDAIRPWPKPSSDGGAVRDTGVGHPLGGNRRACTAAPPCSGHC
jgi:hypothetical protein